MTITPCRNCFQADGCLVRHEKIRAVRGLKLTAIKFKCSLLTEMFPPGQRVQADLKYVCTGWSGYGCEREPIVEPRTVNAVVMGWSGDKVRVYIPYPDSEGWWLQSHKATIYTGITNGHVHALRVFPKQLRPCPDRMTACKHCGLPEGADVPGWSCTSEDGCEYETHENSHA